MVTGFNNWKLLGLVAAIYAAGWFNYKAVEEIKSTSPTNKASPAKIPGADSNTGASQKLYKSLFSIQIESNFPFMYDSMNPEPLPSYRIPVTVAHEGNQLTGYLRPSGHQKAAGVLYGNFKRSLDRNVASLRSWLADRQ